MALSRAFTTRRAQSKQEAGDRAPQRSNTTSRPTPMLRHKISAPVQLIHTTNMLSYNAPDLPNKPNRSNSSATSKTDEDSDGRATGYSTPPTSPDEEPGVKPCSPEPNHLSSYFAAPGDKFERAKTPEAHTAPAIPKRSPSHTKKNSFDAILRSRSIAHLSRESEQSASSKASHTFSRTPSTSTRASSNSHISASHSLKQAAPPVPPPVTSSIPPQRAVKERDPFGAELAQVTELAEEFGTKSQLKTIVEDEQYIHSKGLFKHCAGEYLDDIQSLAVSFFPERNNHPTSTPMWI